MTHRTDPEPEPIEREVLSARVKDRVLQWILEGELAPGSRIIETRVARQLGTSQAPVREALREIGHGFYRGIHDGLVADAGRHRLRNVNHKSHFRAHYALGEVRWQTGRRRTVDSDQ